MDDAVWPAAEHVPEPIKDLISYFYSLADSLCASSSQDLATMVFAPKGEFLINKRRMKGPKQIAKWRTDSSDTITFRRHQVFRVYISDGPGDLLMMGNVALGTDDGMTAESPFCARCVVDDAGSERPQVRLWQVWSDDSPFWDVGILRRPSVPSGVLDTIGGR